MTALRAMKPDVILSVGVPLDVNAAGRAVDLTLADADTIHFYATTTAMSRRLIIPAF